MKKRRFDDILYYAHFYLYRLEEIRKKNQSTIMKKHIKSAQDLHEILSLYHFGNDEMRKIARAALFSWDGPGNSYLPVYGQDRRIIGIVRQYELYPNMKKEFDEYYSGLEK